MLRERKRKSTRQQYKETNDEENDDGERKFNLLEQVKSKRFDQLRDDHLLQLSGEELTLKLIQRNGFEKPILVEKHEGLDLLVPPKSFSVRDVRNYVGHQRIIDVMDVKTQKNIEMSMKDWCKYYESKHRDKLLNVISLEFSHTKLDELVEAPLIVRLLDWVDLVWPKFLKQSQVESTNSITSMKYPKVQKYCLMSVKGSYTDFHIDFGGTSVWYHILRGKKIFWMVPPTELNLQIFEEWTLSGMQQDVFFGDTVEECFKVELCAGNTFFIPSGWIHAVYTLEDSLVFGGNFLHSFGMENQLKVSKIEDATKVPHKFRYPFYTEILWYVVQHYVYCLTDKDHLHRHELEAMAAREKELAEAALLEKNNNKIDSIEIEDETTESEHDDSDNNKSNKKKKANANSKSKKRSKAPTKNASEKKRKPSPPPSTDNDDTDIDSANEELYDTKRSNKMTTNTCRMTKNSLLRLQYEVEKHHEEVDKSQVASTNCSRTSSKSQSEKKVANSISTTESNIKTSPTTIAQKKQQQLASSTINLADLMLSQNESKLNGWSTGNGSNAIWSNPNSEPKEPPRIHITKYEVSGLKVLVKHLSKLSGAKKNLPNLIRNSRALLDDCRKLIADHENDDPELAVSDSTDIDDELSTNYNLNSGNSTGMSSSPTKSKSESTTSTQSKSKVFLNSSLSSEHSTSSVKVEEKRISNSSSSNETTTKSPHKETKCLSPNKKFASTASTSTTTSSSPPPRPKSPPTRPLSNNQYSSKTAKKFGGNLDLPGSFKDLIAATSSAKEAFDVKGSHTTSSFFGPTKDLFLPKTASQSKQPSKSSSSKINPDSLKSPLDILTSPSLITGSSSSSSTGSNAGAGAGVTNPKDPLPSPNFSNSETAKPAAQAQKRFINPHAIRQPQPNKEKLIYASTPYTSPVSAIDQVKPQNQPYPWQTPNPQHHPPPHHNVPNNPHHSSHQTQGPPHPPQPQLPTPSACATIHKLPPHSTNSNQTPPEPSVPTDNRNSTTQGNHNHHHHHHHHQTAQLDLIPLTKHQHSDREKIKSISSSLKQAAEKDKIDDNRNLAQPSKQVVDASPKKTDLPDKQPVNVTNNHNIEPASKSSTSVITGVHGDSVEVVNPINADDQKSKKPTKPRGPPKKSKEARQVIEQDVEVRPLPPQKDSVSVIKIENSSAQPIQNPIIQKPQNHPTVITGPQPSTSQNSGPEKPQKPKRPKKSKEQPPSLPQTTQPPITNQPNSQQHMIQTLMPNLHQQSIRPQQSVICGIVRPPTTSSSSVGSVLSQAGAAPGMPQQQYMITRPLLFNTMPTFSTAQFQQMSRAQMPLFTTPMSSQFGLPLQQGARIVWATQPRGMQPGAPLVATTSNVGSQTKPMAQQTPTTAPMCNPAAAVKALSTQATSLSNPMPKNAHQQDNAALLSLATTALSTAPMTTTPALGHVSQRVSAPQAIMVSSAPSQPLFAATGQPLFRPFVQRMPMTQFVAQPSVSTAARPTTGQLVYARLPNQAPSRFLITQPGFMQPRFAAPHIVTSQPGSTLAYATFTNPANDTAKAIKTKKVKTS